MNQKNEKISCAVCLINVCLIVLAGMTVVYLKKRGITMEWLLSFLPSCVFHSMTGLYCPGCGGTRAVLELMKGHVLQSLWYHPIVLYVVILYIRYLLEHIVRWISSGKYPITCGYRSWYGYGAAVIIIINLLIKNFLLLVYGIPL